MVIPEFSGFFADKFSGRKMFSHNPLVFLLLRIRLDFEMASRPVSLDRLAADHLFALIEEEHLQQKDETLRPREGARARPLFFSPNLFLVSSAG